MTIQVQRPIPKSLWVALPAVLLTVSDAVLTLGFQPPSYWGGDYVSAAEYSPIGAAFLHIHPIAFAAWMTLWACLIVVVALFLQEPWNRVWALMIAIGHTAGTFDWLEDLNYMGALLIFFVTALLTVISWKKADALPEAAAPTITRSRA